MRNCFWRHLVRNTGIAILTGIVCIVAEAATPGGSVTPYTIQTDALDAGGGRNTSGDGIYTNIGSVGLIVGYSEETTAPAYTAGHGYIAQLATLPTISTPVIPNNRINENAVAATFAYKISDAETAAGTLTLAATSSNTTVLPNANISVTATQPYCRTPISASTISAMAMRTSSSMAATSTARPRSALR
jgi:hypothetical protein